MGALTFSQLKARITADGVDDTRAGEVVNQAYSELVERARFLQKKVTLGTTVADQSEYDFPEDDLVQIEYVYIGTTEYQRCSYPELKALQNGGAYRRFSQVGAVAPWFDSDGSPKFEIYPTPTEADLDIEGVASDSPTALSASGDIPITPKFCDQAIIDYARALVYDEEDEDGGNRDRLEAKFEATIARLHRYKHARIGRGAVQARIKGVHIR